MKANKQARAPVFTDRGLANNWCVKNVSGWSSMPRKQRSKQLDGMVKGGSVQLDSNGKKLFKPTNRQRSFDIEDLPAPLRNVLAREEDSLLLRHTYQAVLRNPTCKAAEEFRPTSFGRGSMAYGLLIPQSFSKVYTIAAGEAMFFVQNPFVSRTAGPSFTQAIGGSFYNNNSASATLWATYPVGSGNGQWDPWVPNVRTVEAIGGIEGDNNYGCYAYVGGGFDIEIQRTTTSFGQVALVDANRRISQTSLPITNISVNPTSTNSGYVALRQSADVGATYPSSFAAMVNSPQEFAFTEAYHASWRELHPAGSALGFTNYFATNGFSPVDAGAFAFKGFEGIVVRGAGTGSIQVTLKVTLLTVSKVNLAVQQRAFGVPECDSNPPFDMFGNIWPSVSSKGLTAEENRTDFDKHYMSVLRHQVSKPVYDLDHRILSLDGMFNSAVRTVELDKASRKVAEKSSDLPEVDATDCDTECRFLRDFPPEKQQEPWVSRSTLNTVAKIGKMLLQGGTRPLSMWGDDDYGTEGGPTKLIY